MTQPRLPNLNAGSPMVEVGPPLVNVGPPMLEVGSPVVEARPSIRYRSYKIFRDIAEIWI